MEFLSDSLQEIVAKNGESAVEETDIIESIININEENKEKMLKKISNFLKKYDQINFILKIADYAAIIRWKEQSSIISFVYSLIAENDFCLENFPTLFFIANNKTPDSEETYDDINSVIINDDVGQLQEMLMDSSGISKIEICTKLSNLVLSGDDHDFSLIQACALYGSTKCFKYLFMNQHKIDDITCKFAIAGGSNEIIHILEQNGKNFSGCSVVAAKTHRNDLFEWLNIHFQSDSLQLNDTISSFNEALFFFCINQEYDVNDISRLETAPIIVAANSGMLNIVNFLIDNGADNNQTDKEKNTPLFKAASNGFIPIFELLINKGCAIDSVNAKGNNALHLAASGGNLKIVQILVDKGIGVNSKNKRGLTPLHLAARGGHSKVVQYLISKKADIESKSKNGVTPLHEAAGQNRLDVVKILVDKEVYIDAKDVSGQAAIHYAVKAGGLELVEFLVENDADYDDKDHNGYTPLYRAIVDKHTDIANYLRQIHAKV